MLYIKFTSEKSFTAGCASLVGSTYFDNYKTEQALKFFTTASIANAVLTLASHGLVEGTHFNLSN